MQYLPIVASLNLVNSHRVWLAKLYADLVKLLFDLDICMWLLLLLALWKGGKGGLDGSMIIWHRYETDTFRLLYMFNSLVGWGKFVFLLHS